MEGPQDDDFLEQNGVIACELLKYDKQLERWPYKVYKFWLKIVIVIEIILIALLTFLGASSFWNSKTIAELGHGVFIFIFCSLTAFCCYEMEVALRTKGLDKSKKVLLHLKVCTFISTLYPAIWPIFSDTKFLTLENLQGGAFSLLPLTTFIGTFHVHKVIE